MLKQALQQVMKERGLSSHSAAEAIGVSHTTILRALRGDAVDVDTIIKFANFLKVRPSELIDSMSDTSSLADKLAVLLSHSEDLEKVLSKIVRQVESGDLNPEIINDVVNYAMFKFKSEGASAHATSVASGKRKTVRS